MTDYLSLSLEINKLEERLKETEERLQRALGVIEFYASEDNWKPTDGCYLDAICLDIEELLDHPDFAGIGGKEPGIS